jgi:hypothetical protein
MKFKKHSLTILNVMIFRKRKFALDRKKKKRNERNKRC